MKCRLISLKIQRLISIATKIAPESNLFCNQGEIRVVRSLRKTNKKQNYLMWGQISSPFTTNHNGIIKNANQFHRVCLSKRSFVYPPDSDLDASLNAHHMSHAPVSSSLLLYYSQHKYISFLRSKYRNFSLRIFSLVFCFFYNDSFV